MNKSLRRFEILLPRRFNDGQLIPDALFADTVLEIRRKFGAVTSETQIIHGIWQQDGREYRDELMRVIADVPDDAASIEFFQDFKEQLKHRFKQIEIWMTTYVVHVM
jgi:hypothetical protein